MEFNDLRVIQNFYTNQRQFKGKFVTPTPHFQWRRQNAEKGEGDYWIKQ